MATSLPGRPTQRPKLPPLTRRSAFRYEVEYDGALWVVQRAGARWSVSRAGRILTRCDHVSAARAFIHTWTPETEATA